ncbi:hypothetical protein D9M73_211690 [compost metagenome]
MRALGQPAEDVALKEDLRAAVGEEAEAARLDRQYGPDFRFGYAQGVADLVHAFVAQRTALALKVHDRLQPLWGLSGWRRPCPHSSPRVRQSAPSEHW